MPRAIFTSFQPYGLNYAQILQKEHHWEGLYFFTIKAIENQFRESFPKAIIHDYFDVIKCSPPAELSDMQVDPIDPEWLDEFAVYESIAMNMMERNDATRTFAYRDRLRLYHDHIRYWSTVIRKLKPDYVVFEEEPHEASDLVLYFVAEKLGVKNILFLRLPFFRMFPVSNYVTGSPAIQNAYKSYLVNYSGQKISLAENIEAYLNKIRATYDISKHLYNQTEGLKKLSNKDTVFKKIGRQLLTVVKFFNLAKYPKRIKAVLNFPQPTHNQDQKSKYGDFRTTAMSNWEYNQTINKTIASKKVLKDYYNSIANKEPDTNIPYIIYALNFQPERTTSPIGGHFVNQYLAIEMIAKSLPKGWKLYVKEHPSQFIHVMWGDTYRTQKYYDDIAALPNVQLVPLIYDIYQLIDRSKAVATITGTMAWEAVVREKPAIVFGHTWFQQCEGIFYINSLESLRKTLQKVESGYQPDYNKVRLFTKVLEEYSYKAFVGGNQEFLYANISHEENAATHVKAILDFIEDKQPYIQEQSN